jgi:hypothetical protein
MAITLDPLEDPFLLYFSPGVLLFCLLLEYLGNPPDDQSYPSTWHLELT